MNQGTSQPPSYNQAVHGEMYNDPNMYVGYSGPKSDVQNNTAPYPTPAQPGPYSQPPTYHSTGYGGPYNQQGPYNQEGFHNPLYPNGGMPYPANPSPYEQTGQNVSGPDSTVLIDTTPASRSEGEHDRYADVEGMSETWAGHSFSDKAIRQAFIRKVFLILMAQLAVTVGFISLFIFCEPIKNWVSTTGTWFYFCAYAVFLITYIVLVCCPAVRRKYPGNVICLAIFTLALSYMAGTISCYHKTEMVLIAMAITTAVCLALAIFAIQTKIDFTLCSGFLFVFCIVLFCFGLAVVVGGAFMDYQSYFILHCVYASLAALLFSLFLVYDVQVVMGGRKYELSPEEYIFGALQIYLDVVYLFLIILSFFGGKGD